MYRFSQPVSNIRNHQHGNNNLLNSRYDYIFVVGITLLAGSDFVYMLNFQVQMHFIMISFFSNATKRIVIRIHTRTHPHKLYYIEIVQAFLCMLQMETRIHGGEKWSFQYFIQMQCKLWQLVRHTIYLLHRKTNEEYEISTDSCDQKILEIKILDVSLTSIETDIHF